MAKTSKRRGFFNNIPAPTDADRARIRAEARKNKRPCECPDCLAGNQAVHYGSRVTIKHADGCMLAADHEGGCVRKQGGERG